MLIWTNDRVALYTCNSHMCLITAFFFALSFMIKEILKAFIFSKIIFQSIEAHSYTHHYPQKAAGNCGIYPTATHLPPSFSESPFCEMKTMPSLWAVAEWPPWDYLSQNITGWGNFLTHFCGGWSPRLNRGTPCPPVVLFTSPAGGCTLDQAQHPRYLWGERAAHPAAGQLQASLFTVATPAISKQTMQPSNLS